MVNNFSGRGIGDYPVHIYIFPINVPVGINFFCLEVCGPFKGIKKFIIFSVNDGDETFSKWNQSDLGVYRLDDGGAVDNRFRSVVSAE